MFSRIKMRRLSMHLRRGPGKTAMRIALVGVIWLSGCSGESMHDCSKCGLGGFRIVGVSFPDGGQQWGQADGNGCLTVRTRADCDQVVFTPI